MTDLHDALIVGGGPAGAACAVALARAGRRVVLLERETEPGHKVCGEFLSIEAVRLLSGLGVDPGALGGVPVERLRLAAGGRECEARLPFRGMSVSRRALDDALLRCAAANGAIVRRGARVRALFPDGATWRARLANGDTFVGEGAFLATGKHGLKDWQRPASHGAAMVGFKQHWWLSAAMTSELTGSVELALFKNGYAGLEPVEDGRANLCLLVRRDWLAALGGSWDALLAAVRDASPLIERRLDGAEPCWHPAVAVAGIPFGYLRRGGPGPWRLGDQAAVVPPFTGDGISVALLSAQRASSMFLAGRTADEFHRRLSADLSPLMRRDMAFSRMLASPIGQRLAVRAASFAPRLLRWGAAATRLPDTALAAAGRGSGRRPDPAIPSPISR